MWTPRLKGLCTIHHFHIPHNAPCLPPPKICITFVFHFPWVLLSSQEKLKTMLIQNFGGCGNGELSFSCKINVYFLKNQGLNPAWYNVNTIYIRMSLARRLVFAWVGSLSLKTDFYVNSVIQN